MDQHAHSHSHAHFVPAAGHAWLLPLYDPLNRLLGAERVKRRFVARADLQPGARVLDLGTGTGDLALLAKAWRPAAEVRGVDPDPAALERARAKAKRRDLEVGFDEAFGGKLPYADGSFDRVLSSFVFHHLDAEAKHATLGEIVRVLTPEGQLFLMDFGPAQGGWVQTLGRVLHRDETLRDNTPDALPELMRKAGFASAEAIADENRLIGSIHTYHATV